MKHSTLLSIALLGTTLLTTACSSDATQIKKDTITFNATGLYPESVSYDKNKNIFYVGSLTQGTVGTVDNEGNYELFAQNNKLITTTGIFIDSKNNQLLACNAHPGFNQKGNKESIARVAGLVVYDLNTKKEKAYYDLASLAPKQGHFANDVTTDNQDNIYVTDSFSPNIYKINSKGEKEIFISSVLWDVEQGEFGLNGIVYHPNGFLIVSHHAHAKLYKISLDSSKQVEEIYFDQINLKQEEKINHIDGLQLLNNTLVAVSNNFTGTANGNGVYQFSSQDNWNTASIDKIMLTGQTSPTAVTTVGNNTYVLYSGLQQLITRQDNVKTYTLKKVSYKK